MKLPWQWAEQHKKKRVGERLGVESEGRKRLKSYDFIRPCLMQIYNLGTQSLGGQAKLKPWSNYKTF